MYNVGFNRFGGTPPVIKNLIYINVVMFIATIVLGSSFNIDLKRLLGLYYPLSEYFKPIQIVSHMFMHADIWHIFFNMFALWMFGKVLENVWGSQRFFIYYIVTGLGAAAIHLFVTYLRVRNLVSDGDLSSDTIEQLSYMINIPTVGASGAVYGVLLAFGMLFPNTELMFLFPPVPIKAKYVVIGYGAIELFTGLTQPGSNVAHFAHLGGMLFGFILIKYWNTKRTNFY